MTQLKDVLHLYIGCESKVTGGEFYDDGLGKIVVIDHEEHLITVSDRTIYDRTKYCVEADISDITPILRPLSDMTEDEVNYVYLFIHNQKLTYKWQNAIMHLSDGIRNGGIGFTPELTIYLLSRSFDLFGLIESGQAIDKTKLTTNRK